MKLSLRCAMAAALVTGLAVPAAAWSATPGHYTCHLITDPTGDTQGPSPDNLQQLDLTGADIRISLCRESTIPVIVPMPE